MLISFSIFFSIYFNKIKKSQINFSALLINLTSKKKHKAKQFIITNKPFKASNLNLKQIVMEINKCKICMLKKTNSACSLSHHKDNNRNNNNNTFCFKSYTKPRHKCIHNHHHNVEGNRSSAVLSMENQELISLSPIRQHPAVFTQNDYDPDQVNAFTFRILAFLILHFGLIVIAILWHSYLEETRNYFSFKSMISRLNDQNAKYVVYVVYSLISFFFMIMIWVSRLRIQFPLNYFMFFIYTAIMANFYSYATLYHGTSVFIEFFSIILLTLFLLAMLCLCQRKLNMVNNPYLPYPYIYLFVILFLIIFHVSTFTLFLNIIILIKLITNFCSFDSS